MRRESAIATVAEKRMRTEQIMAVLKRVYGTFPLPETIARHKQLNLFTIKEAPRKRLWLQRSTAGPSTPL